MENVRLVITDNKVNNFIVKTSFHTFINCMFLLQEFSKSVLENKVDDGIAENFLVRKNYFSVTDIKIWGDSINKIVNISRNKLT